eukprot:GGOE01003533.1.p1 GENE.GGOE01003533.1~~GGOE01003533.1.p1  ORF type:complete len:627 (-),score=136.14 GGOE01003533.1:115-1995(-)
MWRVTLLLLLLVCEVTCRIGGQRILFKVVSGDTSLPNVLQARRDFDLWQARRAKGGVVATVAAPSASMKRFLAQYPHVHVLYKEVLNASSQMAAGRRTADAYRTADVITASMQALETSHPALAKVYTIGTSVEGRSILALKLSRSPSVDDPSKPEVVFVAGHHAREWISMEVGLRLAEYVACVEAVVPRIASLLNTVELWFVPLLNPDGYIYTYQGGDRYWRKNREKNIGGHYGVDLNRNYDYLWSLLGASNDPDSETYLGPSPMSEPEVRAMRDFLGYRDPSQTITLPVSATTLQDTTGSSSASIQTSFSHPAVSGWTSASTYLTWTANVTAGARYVVEVLQSSSSSTGATYSISLNCTNGTSALRGTIAASYGGYMQYVRLGVVTPVTTLCSIQMHAVGFGSSNVLGTIYGIRLANRDAPLVMPTSLLSRPIGLLSYHSYGQTIAWPVSGEYQVPANAPLLTAIARKMADLILQTTQTTYDPLMAADTYLASGDAVDWFWYTHDGAPAYTIELPPDGSVPGLSGFVLATDQIEPTTRGNVPAALYFAEYVSKRQNVSWYEQQFVDDGTSSAVPTEHSTLLIVTIAVVSAAALLLALAFAAKVWIAPRLARSDGGPGGAFEPVPQ